MILSLLGLFGGGIMRMLPELLAFFNKKTDNSHELALMDKQIEFQKLKGADDRATIAAQNAADLAVGAQKSDSEAFLAMLDANKEALRGQMQITKIKIVDILNFALRPVVTYIIVGMYVLTKFAMFIVAVKTGISGWDAILKIYDAEDRGILSGILAFWFVGRVYDSKK